MASEYDGQVVTLLVEEGRLKPDGTPGAPIATHVPTRRERYLVFLPKNAPVGQKVKVRLADTGKTDKRDMALFEGQPAPVEYTERWKDNGDGTISRVKIATDWLLQESEAEVMETRSVGRKEGAPSDDWRWEILWGGNSSAIKLLRTVVQEIPILQEAVAEGRLTWEKTGQRRVEQTTQELELLEEPRVGKVFNPMALNYAPDSGTDVVFRYRDSAGAEDNVVQKVEWGQLPQWLQDTFLIRYPACSCGRQRRDVQVSDGYGKCELCRPEEVCTRCGKVSGFACASGFAYPRHSDGRMICLDCWPIEEQDKLVARMLADEHKKLIASEARHLRAGQVLTREEGEAVLKATVDPTALGRMAGYGWYYFSQDGAVHGTKLAPAALEILTFLPGASGNALVEFVAWIAGGAKPANPSVDFYLQTQVEGKQAKPALTEDLLTRIVGRIEAGEPVLTDLLRGPTVDLEKILSKLRQKWLALPGAGCPEGEPYTGKAHWEEKEVKEFIETQFGRSYSSLGNSARRHSVYAECRRAASGNWESLKGLRPLTEPATAWLKERWSWRDSVRDALFDAFRAVPGCEEIASDLRKSAPLPEAQLSEIAGLERDNLLRQREEDFWKFLTSYPSADATIREFSYRVEAEVQIREVFAVCCLCGEDMEELYSYPEEAKFICRNVNKHPAENKVVFDRSNSGLTEYGHATLLEWADRKGPKFHRGRTIACQKYLVGGEVESICRFYPDVNLDEMAKFDRRAEAVPEVVLAETVADAPPAESAGQNQFGEDAKLPDMAAALRDKWGAK